MEPIFLGRRLDLNPIVVFVALWSGGWLWGMPGVVFALPVLVAAKVAASHSSRGDVVVRFLSPSDPEPVGSRIPAGANAPVVLRGRAALR